MKRTVNRELLKKLKRENGIGPVEERNVSVHTLNRMAYADSNPRSITMIAICDAYKVDIDDLFPVLGGGGEEDDGPEAA